MPDDLKMNVWRSFLLALILIPVKPSSAFIISSAITRRVINMPRVSKRGLASSSTNEQQTVTPTPPTTTKRRRGSSNVTPLSSVEEKEEDPSSDNEGKGRLTKRDSLGKGPAHPRQQLLSPNLLLPSTHQYLRIMTWNVNGFKALASTKLKILTDLVEKHSPDLLCLQETKLQEQAVDDYRDILSGYDSYWHCSTVKKGYSGSALFIKKSVVSYSPSFLKHIADSLAAEGEAKAKAPPKKQTKLSNLWGKNSSTTSTSAAESLPQPSSSSITTTQGIISAESLQLDFSEKFSGEGRVMTLETNLFYLVAAYVPNSGEGLVRLSYRVKEWDPAFFHYLTELSLKKPVILTGDLNVGHLDVDIHNPTAKHIAKQAGLTPEERQSFTSFLTAGVFHDAFRFLYPHAIGQFTYWSQRTFARPVNKGIRLDYFICSNQFFPENSLANYQATFVESLKTIGTSAFNRTTTTSSSTTTEVTTETEIVVDVEEKAERREVDVEKGPVPGVVDCYPLPLDTVGCSDHCPVMLVLRVA